MPTADIESHLRIFVYSQLFFMEINATHEESMLSLNGVTFTAKKYVFVVVEKMKT